MELRIRACHVRGSFICRDNLAPRVSTRRLMQEPAGFDYAKLAHPPATFVHEKLKASERIPTARRYIQEHGLNQHIAGRHSAVGIIVQGGLYNSVIRALQQCQMANAYGMPEVSMLVLNVTYPLVPDQVADFAADKRAVLVIEEGQPEYIEQEIATLLRRRELGCALHGKDLLPAAGEYSIEILVEGLRQFAEQHLDHIDTEVSSGWLAANRQRRESVAGALGAPLPPRPPGFCVGCPERPVFAALKMVQADIGRVHIAADIGCHAFATFAPFSSGHSILGYGMSLASSAGIAPLMQRRTLAIMGDGGFWHNGLITGVQSALYNKDDAVLLIFKNGYTSATGTQELISTPSNEIRSKTPDKRASLTDTETTIEDTLAGLGVEWLRTVHTYRVAQMRRALKEAFTSPYNGLKVIIAEGECQLERQRRLKPWLASLLAQGKRSERVRYGVDEDVCTGDHACIRLSGCPTLTLKDNPDPLKVDPVATVIDGCVGCGLCGENAHAATLCPSFYRAEVVTNPKPVERFFAWLKAPLLRALELA
jgi:indolepyruvate ferredoxin oxidoreductase alpha subunit